MAQIPVFITGLPTPKNELVRIATINRSDTTSKVLFKLRKGEMVSNLCYFGNAASNAGTTATLSVGLQLLDNTGAAFRPVIGIYITSPGSGYTSAPTVSFSGGGGSGAAATAVVNAAGQVIGITLTNYGTGYTSAPTVSFSGGGGSNAAATAVVALATSLLNASDVKTAATGLGKQFPTTNALAQFVPMPFDVNVIGTYAETGAASTAGGPWIVSVYTLLSPPNDWKGFYPAA